MLRFDFIRPGNSDGNFANTNSSSNIELPGLIPNRAPCVSSIAFGIPWSAPMFGIFSKSPLKKLKKEHQALLTRAFQAQRDGNIRLYSTLTAEAETLKEKIDSLQAEPSH
ncbi:MAG: hypothetical protein Hals2KO_15770 [Halioglobus sp.]